MLSVQNAKGSRNRLLAARCAVIILLSGALLMLSAIATTKARAQDQPATGKFYRVGSPIPNQYIVVLNDDVSGNEVASIAFSLAGAQRGALKATYTYALKGFSIHDISEAGAVALSKDPRVEFVEENAMGTTGNIESIPTPSDSVPSPWQLDRIDQSGSLPNFPLDNSYTYNQTGSGVNAYVLDTGIRTTHIELTGRAFFGADFVDGIPPLGGDCTSGSSNSGHGTPAAGVIGATTHGVAKSVKMYSVRVCDCAQQCPSDTVMQGIDWVTGQHVKPAVANMSIYIRGGSTAVDKAVRRSIAAGVTYVVSAGNGNPATGLGEDASTVSPARVTQAITVGATGVDASYPVSDARASFSNFGDVLDLFAPGQRTASPAALDPSNPIDNVAIYARFGGTSAAAPAVAGVAALYLQTDTTACPCTVRNVIRDNANPNVVTSPGAGSPPDMLHIPGSWSAPSYRSLSLNGTTAYVNVPTVPGPGGAKLDITTYITVEAWVKLNSVGSAQPIVERYSNSDGGYSLDILGSGKVKFYTLATASNFAAVTGGTALQPNIWYHIVGQWGGLTLKVFVNGVLDGTKSSTFAPGTGASPLFIGRTVDGTSYFNGLIDEVRVTAQWLYNANFTPQNRVTGRFETKGLWRFDYQTAQDCADMNNGTLIGGATFSTSVP